MNTPKVIYHYHIWKVLNDPQKVDRKFLKYLLDQLTNDFKASLGRGGTMMHLTKSGMEQMKVPLPTMDVQEEIVRTLDAEASIVESSVFLSKEFESRISKVISSLWNE